MARICTFCDNLGGVIAEDSLGTLKNQCTNGDLCNFTGNSNKVTSLKCRRVEFPKHAGSLSIKSVRKGKEHYELENGDHITLDDNSYLILNQHTNYDCYVEEDTDTELFAIFFEKDFAAEVLRSITTSQDTLLDDPVGDNDQPIIFFEQLYNHDATISPMLADLKTYIDSDVKDPFWLHEQFHILLGKMLKVHRSEHGEIKKIPAVKKSTRIELYKRLHRAKDFITGNYGKPLTLSQIAGEAFLSPHHFLRLFKKIFKKTPHQYLTRVRLQNAERLLLHSDLSITQICYEVGFESMSHLSMLFNRYYDMPPQVYRNTHREK